MAGQLRGGNRWFTTFTWRVGATAGTVQLISVSRSGCSLNLRFYLLAPMLGGAGEAAPFSSVKASKISSQSRSIRARSS
jgi:hypothetical protein